MINSLRDLFLTLDTHFVCNPVVNLFKMALKTSNHLYIKCLESLFWLEGELSIYGMLCYICTKKKEAFSALYLANFDSRLVRCSC